MVAVSFGTHLCAVFSNAAPLTVIVSVLGVTVSGQADSARLLVFGVLPLYEAVKVYSPTAPGVNSILFWAGNFGYVSLPFVTFRLSGPKTLLPHVLAPFGP